MRICQKRQETLSTLWLNNRKKALNLVVVTSATKICSSSLVLTLFVYLGLSVSFIRPLPLSEPTCSAQTTSLKLEWLRILLLKKKRRTLNVHKTFGIVTPRRPHFDICIAENPPPGVSLHPTTT
ncbi:hypothetical protein J6590_041178 [Homalodisca vitripennis]|nr:hypothetical protein J6590_041178 [Homalodisca vitripennis]